MKKSNRDSNFVQASFPIVTIPCETRTFKQELETKQEMKPSLGVFPNPYVPNSNSMFSARRAALEGTM